MNIGTACLKPVLCKAMSIAAYTLKNWLKSIVKFSYTFYTIDNLQQLFDNESGDKILFLTFMQFNRN